MIEVEKVDFNYCMIYYIKGTKTPHREDGPAMIAMSGTKEWWVNGKRHREDGPAFISIGVKEWWLNGNFFKTKEEWFEALTEEQRIKVFYSEYFIRD